MRDAPDWMVDNGTSYSNGSGIPLRKPPILGERGSVRVPRGLMALRGAFGQLKGKSHKF